MPTLDTTIITHIPIGSIDDPEFNSRLSADAKGLQALAESMPTPDKLINPVTVEETKGDRYLLVTGSRRLAAARLNGWTEIPAKISPKSDEATRIVQNFVENNQRRDLTLYEQARAIVKMRDASLAGTEIAAATGYSAQKVSNLMGMYTRLPPDIHTPWRDGHKAATFEFLQKLAVIKGKTQEDIKAQQLDEWQARASLFDKFDDKLAPPKRAINGKHEDPSPAPTKLVKMQKFFDICRAVQKSKLPGAKLAIDCMKCLIGETDKVKSVYDPAEGTQATQ